MPDAPQPDQLAGVIKRDQHLGAWRLGTRYDDLIPGETMRDHRPPQSQRLARETGIGVESERRAGLGCRVGDKLHLAGPWVVAGESHLLPRYQLARELLHSFKASR